MRYDGIEATMLGRITGDDPEITIHDHVPGEPVETIPIEARSGHGGGDEGMLNALISAIRGEGPAMINSATEALEGHMMAFAAEESRINGGAVINMEEFRQAAHASVTAT
jgi:hypothetical protein